MEKYHTTQRYLPHEVITRFHACKLYDTKRYSISFVCRRYKISKASLMRWMNRYDGTKESLIDKSHRPHSKHPNSHTDTEIKWINNYLRRNPNISMIELYTKLRINRGYSRNPASLFRFLRKQGYYKKEKPKKKPYKPQPYDTPTKLGVKWQVDVKYVPKECKAPTLPHDKKFFQYTAIDEASRERFIFYYDEQTAYNSVDFIKRAIKYFKYQPQIIQSDNGNEFTYIMKTDKVHPVDQLCKSLEIRHQLIRPRTPRHNGKVERSHRNDNERFYRFLKFYSLDDLRYQGKLYLKRANNTAMTTLNYLTPLEKRNSLELSFN
ncbi:DDE-type integrase/transposase/recombinase [Erysipelothrix rhusiopathiae]|nr:DDE-type integrase/transposase/recombinase [Erysipelothrix rhusiopathiae]MDE8293177.1 DDE-type integrase/transposase/recombinase [Erysipelothrix rhusiopathiae]